MTCPSWLTWIKSEALISEKERPNGFTQKVEGSTGSRRVMWPATPVYCQYTCIYVYIYMDGREGIPSSKPFFPKMRNAAARRPLRYSRSACLSSKTGGLGKVILTFWSDSDWPFAVIVAVLLRYRCW